MPLIREWGKPTLWSRPKRDKERFMRQMGGCPRALWNKALLAASPFCLGAVAGSAGESLCRSCPGHHDHFLRPWVGWMRRAWHWRCFCAAAGARRYPPSSGDGLAMGGWRFAYPPASAAAQKSQCRNNAPEGHKRHPHIWRMNPILSRPLRFIITWLCPWGLPSDTIANPG